MFSTVTQNTAASPGDGIRNEGVLAIYDSILAGNAGDQDCASAGTVYSGGHNLVGICPKLQSQPSDIDTNQSFLMPLTEAADCAPHCHQERTTLLVLLLEGRAERGGQPGGMQNSNRRYELTTGGPDSSRLCRTALVFVERAV